MKYRQNKKGSVLLYLIVAMTALTVLGAGIYYMTPTSSFSGLGVTAQNKARSLAESGIRYALSELRNRTLTNTSSPTEYKLTTSATDKFILEISGIGGSGNINIKSTGVSNAGTPYQASHKMALDITPAQYQQGGGTSGGAPESFAGRGGGGMAALAPPALGGGTSGASGVSVDTVNKQITFGSGATNTAGCVWYQGWADSNGSDCIEGRCNFNKGIRAYFDFQYNTPWGADGFTFAIVSAHNNGTEAAPVYINKVTDCGGGICGEYMGYAGPGTSKYGLQPPKIAVEFDPYITAGTTAVCISGSPQCGSRLDSSFAAKHATFTYWGTNVTECSSNTYDDNRHGSGDGTNDPKNPTNGDTNPDATTPYIIKDFDNFGTVITSPNGRRLSFRLEIDRVDDAASSDYRKYKVRAWLKAYTVYTDSNGVTLEDTSKKFNKNNDYPPDFQQTITLTQNWHDKFDRMIFGWTQGTGGATQVVTIRNFQINFKNTNDF